MVNPSLLASSLWKIVIYDVADLMKNSMICIYYPWADYLNLIISHDII